MAARLTNFRVADIAFDHALQNVLRKLELPIGKLGANVRERLHLINPLSALQ